MYLQEVGIFSMMLACLNLILHLAWQMAERASTRLVARGTANEVVPAQQLRYSPMPPGFIPQPFSVVFPQGVPIPPQQPLQPPQSQKRRTTENEDTAAAPAPKKRKAKPKGKAAADGATVTGSTYYLVSAT